MNEYLKSGRQALRLLYFLVISLGITKSLQTLFISDDKFQIPSFNNWILFVIFLSFITRFFLGAYRILSQDIEIELRRPKIVLDAIGFYIQALFFFVYSLNYYDVDLSQWMIISICFFDLVWLCILAIFFGIREKTFPQWISHNIIFIGFCLWNMFSLQNLVVLLIISVIAFVLDINQNIDFYFSKTVNSLRIFVAGPYGDYESKNIIEKNVKCASDIGKELALMGHIPFIPHTMLHGWETDPRFTSTETFKQIDQTWLDYCDALYFIAPSPGANVEKNIATRKGIQIFTSLDQIPKVSN